MSSEGFKADAHGQHARRMPSAVAPALYLCALSTLRLSKRTLVSRIERIATRVGMFDGPSLSHNRTATRVTRSGDTFVTHTGTGPMTRTGVLGTRPRWRSRR